MELANQTSAPDCNIGKLLQNRYRLTQRIGQGGMGIVYRAEHLALGTELAVKILGQDAPRNSDSVARFHREASIAARLAHPNIVSARDFGLTKDGAPFLVMDLVEGQSLEERIEQRGPLSILDTCILLRQIADALAMAHEAGVIHRDIKPANVMVESRQRGTDSQTTARITDFGLAAFQDPKQPTPATAGLIFATPAYASPEQLNGKPMSGKTDVYSLGATAFEMLLGEPPFGDQTAASSIRDHLSRPPPDATARRSEVPRKLSMLIKRMMAKDPSQRPSAVEARDSLGSFLAPNSINKVGREIMILCAIPSAAKGDSTIALIRSAGGDIGSVLRGLIVARMPSAESAISLVRRALSLDEVSRFGLHWGTMTDSGAKGSDVRLAIALARFARLGSALATEPVRTKLGLGYRAEFGKAGDFSIHSERHKVHRIITAGSATTIDSAPTVVQSLEEDRIVYDCPHCKRRIRQKVGAITANIFRVLCPLCSSRLTLRQRKDSPAREHSPQTTLPTEPMPAAERLVWEPDPTDLQILDELCAID